MLSNITTIIAEYIVIIPVLFAICMALFMSDSLKVCKKENHPKIIALLLLIPPFYGIKFIRKILSEKYQDRRALRFMRHAIIWMLVWFITTAVIVFVNLPHQQQTNNNQTVANTTSDQTDNSSDKNADNNTRTIEVPKSDEKYLQLDSNLYTVERVVDGDTFKIMYNGELTSVRLIGIDTPETVDSRKSVKCYGPEASNYLKTLLEGKKVQLYGDSTQDSTDKYGRLLRYANILIDDQYVDVGLLMLLGGYAYEYTYDKAYYYQEAYKEAESYAKENGEGAWSVNTCNGDKNKDYAAIYLDFNSIFNIEMIN